MEIVTRRQLRPPDERNMRAELKCAHLAIARFRVVHQGRSLPGRLPGGMARELVESLDSLRRVHHAGARAHINRHLQLASPHGSKCHSSLNWPCPEQTIEAPHLANIRGLETGYGLYLRPATRWDFWRQRAKPRQKQRFRSGAQS